VGGAMTLRHFLADDDLSQAEEVQILDLADNL
jgi:ornithine carbamoyltransferase